MKIATNVHRDAFGGITISNLALFDWLESKKDTIIGVELIVARHILGPVIFRHYCPRFFRHHIVNGLDIIPRLSWEKMGDPRKKWLILIKAVKDILKAEAVDIILLNGTYNAPWIIGQAANELGIPIVLRYAGVLQQEVSHKNFLVRKRLLRYERWLVESASAIIFPSNLCRKTVEKEVIQEPVKNWSVIPNPVRVCKHGQKNRRGRYTMATIGRWTPIKNFQAFIALHKELLAQEWPHRAVLVTSFKDERYSFPETLERKVSMSHDELLKFYRSIDLVVVTSHFETFSNVAAEALVNGTSVLVSKNVGFSEILNKAGLKRMVIESFDNPKKVANTVKELSKTRLSQSEIRRVTSLLSPENIHQKIIRVLNNTLEAD